MKTSKIITIVIIILFSFATCSKDEDDKEIKETGTITIEGVEYNLSYGELFSGDYGEIEGYGFDIILVSVEGDDIENATVADFLMQMEFYSENSDDLKSGIYAFDQDSVGAVGTFGHGLFAVGWDDDTWEADALFSPTGGTFEVEKEGEAYYLTINLLTDKYDGSEVFGGAKIDSNVAITGNYQGNLEQRYSSK